MASWRQELLEEHGLSCAPPEHQRAFWVSYNQRSRREAIRLGDVAAGFLSGWPRCSAERRQAVVSAWEAVVPSGFEALSRVGDFARGRLQVVVDGAATKYYLSRQAGDSLVLALNQRLGAAVVREIDYRIGSLVTDASHHERS